MTNFETALATLRGDIGLTASNVVTVGIGLMLLFMGLFYTIRIIRNFAK